MGIALYDRNSYAKFFDPRVTQSKLRLLFDVLHTLNTAGLRDTDLLFDWTCEKYTNLAEETFIIIRSTKTITIGFYIPIGPMSQFFHSDIEGDHFAFLDLNNESEMAGWLSVVLTAVDEAYQCEWPPEAPTLGAISITDIREAAAKLKRGSKPDTKAASITFDKFNKIRRLVNSKLGSKANMAELDLLVRDMESWSDERIRAFAPNEIILTKKSADRIHHQARYGNAEAKTLTQRMAGSKSLITLQNSLENRQLLANLGELGFEDNPNLLAARSPYVPYADV